MTIHSAPLDETAGELRGDRRELVDYIEEIGNRIQTVEPKVKALVPESNRQSRLEGAVSDLQERYPEPDDRPPLFGVPVGVKDIIHVDGLPTKANSDVPSKALTGPEANVVTALRQAGALILGKTVTTEFACFNPGPTRNPYNLDHTPGGSSSGSAAAVAAGLCPLALGSQTGGSTIRPAAYCGVVGYKPSLDRIPTDGMLPLSESADHIGVITQDVPGMRLGASILCRDWDRKTDSKTYPVLGVPKGPYLNQASEEGLSHFEQQLDRLEQADIQIRRISIFDNIDDINDAHYDLLTGEIVLSDHHGWFEKYGDRYSSMMADIVREGREVSVGDLAFARQRGLNLREDIEGVMQDHDVDMLVSPAATGPAPEGIESTGSYKMNLPWTYAGVPTITVPASRADNGLPTGLQCVTFFNDDEALLRWGERVANVLKTG